MKSINEIINESSSNKVFLILHCNSKDNIRNDYYFWTSLSEEDTKIVNYQYPSDKLKEVLIDCADFGNRHPEFKNICLYINIFGKWEFASYPTSGQPLYFGKEIRDLQNSSHRVTNISVILNLYNGNGRYPAFNQIAIEGKDYYKKREQ